MIDVKHYVSYNYFFFNKNVKLKNEIYIVVYFYGSYLHIEHAITIDSGYITYFSISNFNSTHCKRESRLSCEDNDQSPAFNDYIKGVMA